MDFGDTMDIYTHITEDTDGTLSKPLASYLNKDTISKNVYIKSPFGDNLQMGESLDTKRF